MARMKTLLLGLALAGAAAGTARAEYLPPDFFELAGYPDAVVVGTIIKVSPATFTLRVEETLAGPGVPREIEVLRFEDWTCSVRWKPYRAGQREIAFLYELDEQDARWSGAGYGLMSAGDEGEWEIAGNAVSVQGFRVPGGHAFNQGEHPGQWLPLRPVLDALRSFRDCFSVVPGEDIWHPQVLQTCSARKLATYRSRSNVHAYLAETALSRAVPATRSQ